MWTIFRVMKSLEWVAAPHKLGVANRNDQAHCHVRRIGSWMKTGRTLASLFLAIRVSDCENQSIPFPLSCVRGASQKVLSIHSSTRLYGATRQWKTKRQVPMLLLFADGIVEVFLPLKVDYTVVMNWGELKWIEVNWSELRWIEKHLPIWF